MSDLLPAHKRAQQSGCNNIQGKGHEVQPVEWILDIYFHSFWPLPQTGSPAVIIQLKTHYTYNPLSDQTTKIIQAL
jgi:hypothetical protein